MAVTSKELTFSDDQALTANAVSTNVIDLGAVGTPPAPHNGGPIPRKVGSGDPIPLLIQVTEDFTGTSPTLKATVEISDDEAFSSPVSVGESVTLSDPKAGDKLSVSWLPQDIDKRYVRLNYTVGGTSPSGKVFAGIASGHQTA